MSASDQGNRLFHRREMPSARLLPRLRLITWRPPRLPFRGIALLVGPLSWEVEVNPDSGRPETATLGLRTPGAAWHLDLLTRRLSKCGGSK
jgi:hypothetical protein